MPKDEISAWLESQPPAQALSYVFQFPFDIHYHPGVEKASISWEGHTWTLHPPFVAVDQREPPQLSIDGAPPDVDWDDDDPRVAARITLTMVGSDIADAIRLDVRPPIEVGPVQRVADAIVAQLRARTLQWWVEKDRRNTDGYLKHRVALDESGSRVGPVEAFLSYSEPFGFERPVDQPALQGALAEAVKGHRPPVFYALLLDGVYNFAVDHRERAILDLAACCEAALDHYLLRLPPSRASRSKVRKALRLKFEDRIETGLGEVLGRPFSEVDSEGHAELRSLWIARGMVAHGKAPMTRRGAERSPTTSADVHGWVLAVARFREWLHKAAV